MVRILQYANLAFSFILELVLLAAFAFAGYVLGDGVMRYILALGVPVIVIVIWGAFLAPRAARPAPPPVKLALKIALFGLAALGLVQTGNLTLAVFFAVAVALNLLLAYVWRQE
jgi:hypothetical protein